MRNKSAERTVRTLMNRRQFLQAIGITFTGSSLAACGIARSTTSLPVLDGLAPSHPILSSPQPMATAESPAAATPSPAALPLDDFLALSAVLTGFENLNPVLGHVYLQSLQANGQWAVTIAQVYTQAGFGTEIPPTTIEELELTGVFEQEDTRKLLDKIIEYWYTGVYDTAEGEQAVATYVDALMWQALYFTKPPTICGAPDFWSEPPERISD